MNIASLMSGFQPASAQKVSDTCHVRSLLLSIYHLPSTNHLFAQISEISLDV
jgi:hypothetical protein